MHGIPIGLMLKNKRHLESVHNKTGCFVSGKCHWDIYAKSLTDELGWQIPEHRRKQQRLKLMIRSNQHIGCHLPSAASESRHRKNNPVIVPFEMLRSTTMYDWRLQELVLLGHYQSSVEHITSAIRTHYLLNQWTAVLLLIRSVLGLIDATLLLHLAWRTLFRRVYQLELDDRHSATATSTVDTSSLKGIFWK